MNLHVTPKFDLSSIEGQLFAEVALELHRQVEKWGIQTHPPVVWQAILAEEAGEVAKAVLENWYQGKPANEEEYRTELIQTAAVAISALRSLELTKQLPDEAYEHLRPQINEHVAAEIEQMQADAMPHGLPLKGITPTYYGEPKAIDPALGALMVTELANARLLDAAHEAIRIVSAQHPNVRIAPPFAFPGNKLAFTAVRPTRNGGYEGLQGQEDFTRDLQTCKNDTELILAIAKRIEREMELPSIIRGTNGE